MNDLLLERCFEQLSNYRDVLLEDESPDEAMTVNDIVDEIQNVLEN